MRKTSLMILLSSLLTVAPQLAIYAGKKSKLVPGDIEKIENKYEELSKNAPFVKAKGVSVAQTLRFIQPEDNVIKDYSKLRQIALVRHGEPDMVKTGKFTCDGANQYLKCYDSVCIIVPEKPFFNLENEKKDLVVFSSPITRAITTAHYLCGDDRKIIVSPDFREFENKVGKTNSKRKMPIKFWTTTARIKWMMGIDKQKDIESFSDAKQRAKRAAKTLSDAATSKTPKVLLTAHGMQNRYVKKNLEKMGWKVVKDTGNDYFGTTILVKIEE